MILKTDVLVLRKRGADDSSSETVPYDWFGWKQEPLGHMDIHRQSYSAVKRRHQDADKENGFRKAIIFFSLSQGHGHGISWELVSCVQ